MVSYLRERRSAIAFKAWDPCREWDPMSGGGVIEHARANPSKPDQITTEMRWGSTGIAALGRMFYIFVKPQNVEKSAILSRVM